MENLTKISLRKLKTLQNIYIGEIRRRNDIRLAQREKRLIREANKKYKGKYFKYKNGSASGEWFIYLKVFEVTSECSFKALAFQIGLDGEMKIEFDDMNFFYAQKEMTEKEFRKAKLKLPLELAILL